MSINGDVAARFGALISIALRGRLFKLDEETVTVEFRGVDAHGLAIVRVYPWSERARLRERFDPDGFAVGPNRLRSTDIDPIEEIVENYTRPEERRHCAVLVELAEVTAGPGITPLPWPVAAMRGHDGIVDNSELIEARRVLGEDRCERIYTGVACEVANR